MQPPGLETYLGACRSAAAVGPARAAPGLGASDPWNRRHCDPHRRAFYSGTHWKGAGPIGGDHRTAGDWEALGGGGDDILLSDPLPD